MAKYISYLMQLITVVEKILTEIIRNIYALWYFLNSWTRFLVLSFQIDILVEQRGPARKL